MKSKIKYTDEPFGELKVMQIYTDAEARQKLAIVLDQAENPGKVLIRRKDGRPESCFRKTT